jgi:LEA14-like dessication related protein
MILRRTIYILIVAMVLSCSTFKKIVDIKEPVLSIDQVSVTSLSFESISLLFDIGISNPNQLSVKLNGFDYNLFLDDQNFISGQQIEDIYVKSLEKSSIKIPLHLNFKEIYQSFQSLTGKDSVRYQLKVGMMFDLPILGKTRIPIQTIGNVPLLKLPSISIESLVLKKFSFTGANLDLRLKVKNPNPISIAAEDLIYQFNVNGIEWISGQSQTQQKMQPNDNSIINFPINLNFLQMGQAVYQIVSGENTVNYQLKGAINLGSEHPLLQKTNLPFDQTGQLKIQK